MRRTALFTKTQKRGARYKPRAPHLLFTAALPGNMPVPGCWAADSVPTGQAPRGPLDFICPGGINPPGIKVWPSGQTLGRRTCGGLCAFARENQREASALHKLTLFPEICQSQAVGQLILSPRGRPRGGPLILSAQAESIRLASRFGLRAKRLDAAPAAAYAHSRVKISGRHLRGTNYRSSRKYASPRLLGG